MLDKLMGMLCFFSTLVCLGTMVWLGCWSSYTDQALVGRMCLFTLVGLGSVIGLGIASDIDRKKK